MPYWFRSSAHSSFFLFSPCFANDYPHRRRRHILGWKNRRWDRVMCRLVNEAGPEGRKRSCRICHGFVEGMNKTMGSLLVFRPLHKEGTNHVLTTHGPYLDNRFIATNQITGPVALWIRLAHTTFFPSEYQDGHDGPSRCRYFWFVVGCRSLNKAQETGIAKPSIAGLVVSVSILHSLGRDGTSLLPVSK